MVDTIIVHNFKKWIILGQASRPSSSTTSWQLPPRYGSSAEDSSSPPKVEEDEKDEKPKKKRGKKAQKDADHAPLTSGKKGNKDDDDDESDDLDGLETVLDQDGDKNVNRKPASKTKESTKKRPAASRGSKKKDCIGRDVHVMNMYSNPTMVTSVIHAYLTFSTLETFLNTLLPPFRVIHGCNHSRMSLSSLKLKGMVIKKLYLIHLESC